MNWQARLYRVLLAALISMAASAAQAANPPPSNAPTVGSSILPKSSQLLTVQTPGDLPKADGIALFDWPQQVRKVNGRWVQIVDNGGYALQGKPVASRWVRKDDVVMLGPSPNGVLDNFTGAITTAERSAGSQPSSPDPRPALARLYWLRGIYWQTSVDNNGGGQDNLAYQDFRTATEIDPTLADAWLRRGKLAARLDPTNQFSEDDWMLCFAQAYTLYANAMDSVCVGGCPTSQVRPCLSTIGVDAGAPSAAMPAIPFTFSPKCPPQLYLEIGLAYTLYYKDAHESFIDRLADIRKGTAAWYLGSAQYLLDDAREKAGDAENDAREAGNDAKKAPNDAPKAESKTKKPKASFSDAKASAELAKDRADKARQQAQTARKLILRALLSGSAERATQPPEPMPSPAPPPTAAVDREAAEAAIANANSAIEAANNEVILAQGDLYDARSQHQPPAPFDAAVAFLRWAQDANHDWFLPGSALGSFYLAHVEAVIGDLNDDGNFRASGAPKAWLSADDLLAALCGYERSIRLNDHNDDPLRGRAKVLRYLAISTLHGHPVLPSCVSPRLRRQIGILLDLTASPTAISKARSVVLDEAYVSAKAASFVANDQNAEDLETRALVEMQLAFEVLPNISVEYLAQAQETLRQAAWFTRSTTDRNRRDGLSQNAAYLTRWQLDGFAMQDDTRFQSVWRHAKKLRHYAEAIWKALGTLPVHDDPGIDDLAEATARARRAIAEINELEQLLTPRPHGAGAAPPAASAMASVAGPAAGQAASASATVQNQNASTPSARTGAPAAFGAQPWPDDQLPMRDELLKRLGRIRAWEKDLLAFRCAVDRAQSSWYFQTWPAALQQALSEAALAIPTAAGDCNEF